MLTLCLLAFVATVAAACDESVAVCGVLARARAATTAVRFASGGARRLVAHVELRHGRPASADDASILGSVFAVQDATDEQKVRVARVCHCCHPPTVRLTGVRVPVAGRAVLRLGRSARELCVE